MNRVLPPLATEGTEREAIVQLQRASGDKRSALTISDADPAESGGDIWRTAADAATIGIFLLVLFAALYFCRNLLVPILTAIIVGTTLAPIVKQARGYGIPTGVTAAVLVIAILAVGSLGLTMLSALILDWIGRAPELGALIKQKLDVFERTFAALREVKNLILPHDGAVVSVDTGPGLLSPVVGFLTPAAWQIVVFVGTLVFYLIEQMEFRRQMVSLFSSRDAKLRFLRIMHDIEHNLTGYLSVVTVINLCLGVVVAIGAWLFGLPSPAIIGLLATVLNYIPYLGPAAMAFVVLTLGLVAFPTLGGALLPVICFIGLTTLEGQFITPAVMGRRLTLNPLTIFLVLAFWTWFWGPIGAFLAVPLSIVGVVTFNHLFPDDDVALPE